MKYVTCYVTDKLRDYLDDVAIGLNRSRSYVIVQLLEKAVELLKKGEIEL